MLEQSECLRASWRRGTVE